MMLLLIGTPNEFMTCATEQGRDQLLFSVFEGEPFCSKRIASFANESDARYFLYDRERIKHHKEALLAALEPQCGNPNPSVMVIQECVRLIRHL